MNDPFPDALGQLVPTGGGDPIPLLRPKLLIGRRPDCDIQLQFHNVSSKHCELEFTNGYWHVRDLNSTNGIKVNGVRQDTKFLLPNDELSIAKHGYQIVYQPQTSEPPPMEEDVFSMSLMEKAGLEQRRPKRKPRSNDSTAQHPSPVARSNDSTAEFPAQAEKKSKSTPPGGSSIQTEEDEDKILDWLSE